jgi:hypothetical protein
MQYGGAFMSGTNLDLRNCAFESNEAPDGGALRLSAEPLLTYADTQKRLLPTASIVKCRFVNNTGAASAGAIDIATLINMTIDQVSHTDRSGTLLCHTLSNQRPIDDVLLCCIDCS